MSDGSWCTYPEAAVRLGITVDAVRRRAFRHHWVRRAGNDGRTRVLVPDDLAPPALETRSGHDRPDASGLMSALVDTLRAENGRLVAQLATAEWRVTAADARAVAAEAGRDKADARADTLIAELAGANERATAADARATAADARVDKLVADLADMAAAMAEAENLKAELASADARVNGAEGRAAAAETQRAAAEEKADQLVSDLNTLAARMSEVLVQQLTPGPEPEPERSWWQRWRRRA
jgi:hypothetical protein